ncbi:MAG: acetaldehyde dehydrogenase (acetylating) [Candidatus Curtissbacteria bacterium]|nr:acetaldehyde dehydrogenase (acetylating) [Candidatus Curtissbacteria bacterium]
MQKIKIKVGIIGTGNIGCDLLVKVQRSKVLECGIFAGQNPNSEGIKMARSMGVNTSYKSINSIVDNPEICDIVFDATSAQAHLIHAPILKKLNKFTIDMTPSRVGKMCVPILNLEECLNSQNVNMVTCGGQDTVPVIWAIMKIHPQTKYVEIVSSIASKSAGIATRENIDEYTQTTSEGIKAFTKVPNAKAIIILNPSEPPIVMHNTIYAKVDKPNIAKLSGELKRIVAKIRQYVPGFRIIAGPVFENNRLTVINEVRGLGDFLPVWAGNLDIINCAAVRVAEEYARRKLL